MRWSHGAMEPCDGAMARFSGAMRWSDGTMLCSHAMERTLNQLVRPICIQYCVGGIGTGPN